MQLFVTMRMFANVLKTASAADMQFIQKYYGSGIYIRNWISIFSIVIDSDENEQKNILLENMK